MTNKPSMSIIRGLLFTYDIENTEDFGREKLIASKDINNEKELTELFDELTKPDFLDYSRAEQKWFIASTTHFLAANDNFNEVFDNMAIYFSAPVADQRKFIQVLLICLEQYYNTTKSKS